MDPFDFDDNGTNKNDTSNPIIPRFPCLPKIKTVLRVIEIFTLLVFLSYASTRLPFAVKISGEYFRRLIRVVVSPLFIFLLSNVILLTLFFKSRQTLQHDPQVSVESHLDFLTDHCTDDCTHFTSDSSPPPQEIVFQDKQTILEVRKIQAHGRSRSMNSRRSSDKVMEEDNSCSSCGKHLRRSDTERGMRVVEDGGGEAAEMVDELSNEELQKAADAFIAKQIKFHQEEKLAIVLS